MSDSMIQVNITRIRKQIAAVESVPGSVQLLAVSKYHSAAAIAQAVSAGQRHFAESELQAALLKIASLDDTLIWHFIGVIQSNKAARIAEHFDWVHSVSRLKVAEKLNQARLAVKAAPLNICLQVNISEEPQKSGVTLQALPALAEAVVNLPGLRLRGLMAIAQQTTDIALQRQQFRDLHAAYQDLRARGYALDTLSMGMSGDFDVAITEGATMVRLGSAIFGKRELD